MRKIQLPERFKDGDGNSVAEVQASGFRPHRKPDTAFPVCFQKVLRKAFGLLAEKQVAILLKISLRVAPGCFGGQAPHLLYIVFGKEVL